MRTLFCCGVCVAMSSRPAHGNGSWSSRTVRLASSAKRQKRSLCITNTGFAVFLLPRVTWPCAIAAA